MREIKFRVWETSPFGNQMRNVDLFFFEEEGIREVPEDTRNRYEVMQFTGLLDRHDKEIYEGDIVHYLEMNLTVAWSDTLARPILRPYTIAHHYDLNADVAEECEIIGNIYETPELMPKEDKE